MTDRCQAPRCGRPLKTDESKARGYGPVCWGRINPAAPQIHSPGRAADPDQIALPLEEPVDAETRKQAIDTLARRQLAEDVRDVEHRTTVTYNGISDDDTQAIAARVLAIVESIRPSDEQYAAAREHLADSCLACVSKAKKAASDREA